MFITTCECGQSIIGRVGVCPSCGRHYEMEWPSRDVQSSDGRTLRTTGVELKGETESK